MIRKSELSDVSRILQLCSNREYDADPFRDILSDRVIVNGERLSGYGAVKRFTEAVLVLDKQGSTREKVESLKKLMNAAIFETKKVGVSELHVFTTDDSFANILKKHFNFVNIKGHALVRELNG